MSDGGGGGKVSRRGSNASSEKDNDAYRQKRDRNNMAVKKSREKSRQKTSETSQRMATLRAENEQLEQKVNSLSQELNIMKELLLEHARGNKRANQSEQPKTTRPSNIGQAYASRPSNIPLHSVLSTPTTVEFAKFSSNVNFEHQDTIAPPTVIVIGQNGAAENSIGQLMQGPINIIQVQASSGLLPNSMLSSLVSPVNVKPLVVAPDVVAPEAENNPVVILSDDQNVSEHGIGQEYFVVKDEGAHQWGAEASVGGGALLYELGDIFGTEVYLDSNGN